MRVFSYRQKVLKLLKYQRRTQIIQEFEHIDPRNQGLIYENSFKNAV